MGIVSSAIAAFRLLLMAVWTLVLLGPFLAWSRLDRSGSRRIARLWHGGICRIVGLRLKVEGQVASGAALLVANHSSYLDIPVLGSVAEAAFIAKVEVGGWPVLGFLSRITRTICVARRACRTQDERERMQQRLEQGESLILFPEGTSSDGLRVLPFKSAFFAASEAKPGARAPLVQPISVAYTHLDGLPVTREWRPFLAWYGAMELVPHLWSLLKMGSVQATIRFHAPLALADFGCRKALARRCHAVVAAGFEDAMRSAELIPNRWSLPVFAVLPFEAAHAKGQ